MFRAAADESPAAGTCFRRASHARQRPESAATCVQDWSDSLAFRAARAPLSSPQLARARGESVERGRELLDGHGVRESQVPLAPRAERGAGHGYLFPILAVLVMLAAMFGIWSQLDVDRQSSVLAVGWPILGAVTGIQTFFMCFRVVRPYHGFKV